MVLVRIAFPPVLAFTVCAVTLWHRTAATILISPGLAAQQVAGSNLIAADVSNDQGSAVAEAYLKEGLEIFKFGMTVEELNKVLPPINNNESTWEKKFYENGIEYYSFARSFTDFGQLQYVWRFLQAFDRERVIFEQSPCFSKLGSIRFYFQAEKLSWIRLSDWDWGDCESHMPIFEAITNFYKVKIVKFVGLGMDCFERDGRLWLAPFFWMAQHLDLELTPGMNCSRSTGDQLAE